MASSPADSPPLTAVVMPRPPLALGGDRFRILIFLVLLTSTATFSVANTPVSPDCGKPQQLNRVVGGEDSMDAQWPWIVSILKNGTHHCAGSLLTNRWVVTAAHCFRRYSVKEGTHADIALVRLEHSVRFSERILPICLPDSSVRLLPNTDCWIAGWGSIRDGVPLPHPQTLQKLKVPIIDSEVCKRLYWRGAGQEAIAEDMLCAGYLEGERDACLGDSGGPLMCQVDDAWLLTGIISWGEGCAERNRPGVYTSLIAHRSWVQRIVQGVQLRGHLVDRGNTGSSPKLAASGTLSAVNTFSTAGRRPRPAQESKDVLAPPTVRPRPSTEKTHTPLPLSQ